MVSLLARVIGVGTGTANVRMMSASLIGRLGPLQCPMSLTGSRAPRCLLVTQLPASCRVLNWGWAMPFPEP